MWFENKNWDQETLLAATLRIDHDIHAMTLGNHVALRASGTQGSSFLSLYLNSFSSIQSHFSLLPSTLKENIKLKKAHGHLVLCFSLICRIMGLTVEETMHMFLFLHARAIISSAVRLGVIGPYKGQSLLLTMDPIVESLLKRDSIENCSHGWGSNPVLDILQGGHDRLYSRLFNS